MKALGPQRGKWLIPALAGITLAVSLTSLAHGTASISPAAIASILAHRVGIPVGAEWYASHEEVIVVSIRLPRLLLGLAIGSTLAMAGACLQGLFRNPLADPGLIGVAGGGGIGAVAAFVLGGMVLNGLPGLEAWILPLFAATGSIGTTFLVYQLAKVRGVVSVPHLLLTGIAVNAIATALIGSLIFLATDDQLRRFAFWTLGSLQRAGWRECLPLLLVAAVALATLPRYARALDALLLGESEAYHLGVDLDGVKRALVLLCATAVGAGVAIAGIIGFIGLVAPHLVRLIAGPGHRVLLPASALLGAALLVGADLIARTALSPSEIPIGILTALVGGPFFLYLLHRDKQRLVP